MLSTRSIVSRVDQALDALDLFRVSHLFECFRLFLLLQGTDSVRTYIDPQYLIRLLRTGLSTPNICMLIVGIRLAFATLLARGRRCTLSFWDLIFFDVITLSIVNQSLEQ